MCPQTSRLCGEWLSEGEMPAGSTSNSICWGKWELGRAEGNH